MDIRPDSSRDPGAEPLLALTFQPALDLEWEVGLDQEVRFEPLPADGTCDHPLPEEDT